MGYTHYWYYNPVRNADRDKAAKQFADAAAKIRQFRGAFTDLTGARICGGLGEGEPAINQDEIWFNGDDAAGESCETFRVTFGEQEPNKGFNFCKTQRHRYDTLVCLSLIVLKEHLGSDVFSYSSDGDDSDWDAAYSLYRQIEGKDAPKLET